MRTTILFALIAISFVFHGCGCDHVKPYTTFSTIDLQVGYREFQDGVQNVELFWNANDVRYLAREQCSGGGLVNTAYALKCEPDGYNGLKSPITKIDVISTTRFSEEHPAGTPLNEFVEMETTTDGYQPLNEVNNWEETYSE